MKPYPENRSTLRYLWLSLPLAAGLALPLPALAGAVALATSPLATSTTSTVKPNIMFILDNSGSMNWDHMPDDASDGGSSVPFSFGYYGLRSNQCNQVYYDPTFTYTPPIKANGTSYPDAIFSGAWTDGFDTSAGTVDLRTGFRASQSLSGDSSGQTAYYYHYSGAQTTQLQKNYNSTSNTFYSECHSAQNASPGTDVFTKISLSSFATATTATIAISGSVATTASSIKVNGTEEIMFGTSADAGTNLNATATNVATQINICTSVKIGNCTTTGGHGYTASTSGGSTVTITGLADSAVSLTITKGNTGTMIFAPTIFPKADSDKLTNFANWYSYYRSRMLMMKTAAGRAFSTLNQKYRVGFMKISSSSTATLGVNTFWNNSDTSLGPVSTQRTDWYNALYNSTTSGSTPLRTALSNAGRYYAGKLAGTDPLQYSCQQNFTILSTDGYWNAGDGFKLDGSAAVGNQDGTAGRPQFDGAQAGTTVTTTYTRHSYASTGTRISGGSNCTSPKKRLLDQPQIQSCSITTISGVAGAETCTTWSNSGSKVYVSPYTSASSTCTSTVTLPSPNPSTRVVSGTPVTTPGTSGGSSDSLADVAMYYYQTDLRTPTLGNCTGAIVPPATTGSIVCSTPAVATDPDPYNNVFKSGTDNNVQQHMNTFTLGLGASGWMNYSSSYLGDTSGDYVSVKLGSTADSTATTPVCPWQADGTVCNWPIPGMSGSNGLIANIDDLWHAAVNGRGAYFSATNPTTLAAGLSNALTSINSKIGSAAAAATSTLNPVAGNNFAYVASYTTVKWLGNLEARGINVDTGVVSENASWCVENVAAQACPAPGAIVADTSGATTVYNCVTPDAVICTDGTMVGTDCLVQVATSCTGTMNAKVTDTSDTRIIKTANDAGTALIDFDTTYRAAHSGYFDAARISGLSQWPPSSDTSAAANAFRAAAVGDNLLSYLRGQHGHEYDRTSVAAADQLYRNREGVLGDALESQPAYIGAPVFSYPYPGYSDYVTAQTSRAGTVYMGANDGMMHAFASDTGVERWAYVPSMVIPNLWQLADKNYSIQHANYVNGSPITSDICVSNCSNANYASTTTTADDPVWKTILVAGLNGGGRGYYALDITVPGTPALLWEFTPAMDSDLGYSFGQPVITRKSDGTWVVLVTSGYDNGTLSSNSSVNNSPAGSGKGYLYVLNAASGAIMSKISTGIGDATTPSGLAKIAGWNAEPAGNKVSYVYGGDLQGNVWRFDINSSVANNTGIGAVPKGEVLRFATLFSDTAGTSPQPITTTPILGNIAGKRVIFIGTGKYLETGDLTTSQKQTQYAIKDDDATTTLVNPRTTLINQTLTNNPDGTATRLASGNAVNFFADRGWYIDFPDTGERVNIDAKLVQGTLLVATIVPSNTVCSPGGYGWLNFFDYKTGGSVTPTPGIPLASVKYDSTIVGINILYVQGSPIVEVVTSTNPTPKKDPDVTFKATAVGFTGKRVIWRELVP